MALFRQPKVELYPLPLPSSSQVHERIFETIRELSLDPEQTMLVGSAAATLYGIRLPERDPILGQLQERPSDVDFAASPHYMNHLYTHDTPTGLKGNVKEPNDRQTVMRFTTQSLPADVITRFHPDRHNFEAFHTRFMGYIQANSQVVAVPGSSTSFRIITPYALTKELERNQIDPKAAQDLRQARMHFNG